MEFSYEQNLYINPNKKQVVLNRRIRYNSPVLCDSAGDFHNDIVSDDLCNTLHDYLTFQNDTSKEMKSRSFSEPMEVDTSGDLNKTPPLLTVADVDTSIRNRSRSNLLKSRNTGLVSEVATEIKPTNRITISKFSKILLILICILLCGCVYVILIGDISFYINPNSNLCALENELQTQLLQQDEAIKIITHTFNERNYWSSPHKILPFIGTTGVGKTFTANLIKNYFSPNLVTVVLGHDLLSLERTRKTNKLVNSCCLNLIVIDNLKALDLNNLIRFINTLPPDIHMLIIPIFNVHDTNDGVDYKINEEDFNLIRNTFDTSGKHFELVVFNEIDYNVIKIWLTAELEKRNFSLDKQDRLIKFLLADHPVKFKGFKGLHTKLSLLGKIGETG